MPQVSIRDFAFHPGELTVNVGETVTWTNDDTETDHTVTADDGSFGSAPFPPRGTFSHTFTTRGRVPYHCSLHSTMRGTVTVT
ncbi:plastocyanin/azurin family copper-binding protein [Streptomyces huiliensis]|uniref:plastocyanin/azurin family copper-binding protein n=1 Tax=Streptomyces huiliensis TaxID=2876027 RepID=UPI001CC060F3|nr:plastocyanin/azurin family copper-binding protein [Streptomyces huiliensis]MBZ4322144.1 plastocyanin [Streptomyces huiliensis]